MYRRNNYNRAAIQYSRPFQRKTPWVNRQSTYRRPFIRRNYYRRSTPLYKVPNTVSTSSGRPLTLTRDISISLRYLLSRNFVFTTHVPGCALS